MTWLSLQGFSSASADYKPWVHLLKLNVTCNGQPMNKGCNYIGIQWFTICFFIITTLLLFNYSCLHFFSTPTPYPSQTYLPPLHLPSTLVLSMCPSWKPLSPLSLPPSPLAIVRLFLTSMSLVIFCLLFSSVDYVLVKGEIIWYLSLTAWLISLSIMLSSPIHAVEKGISSFFLSAA